MAAIKLPVDVTVLTPDFRPSSSLGHLDLASLSKIARTEIAIGDVDGGCCRHTVYARIQRGFVVDIRTEACPSGEGSLLSKKDLRTLAAALRGLKMPRSRGRQLPVPVATFFRSASAARLIVVQTLVCVRICILGFCFTCCRRLDDTTLPIVCGRVTIDTTRPGVQR